MNMVGLAEIQYAHFCYSCNPQSSTLGLAALGAQLHLQELCTPIIGDIASMHHLFQQYVFAQFVELCIV